MIAKLTVGLMVFVTQCVPACEPPDPGYALRHDFSLSPGIEVGKVTSCIDRDSTADGRDYLCRVVLGYEEVNQPGNWRVDAWPTANGSPDHVIAQSGNNESGYGMSIVLNNGQSYEGCRWYSPSNDYDCDYATNRHVVLATDATDFFGYALRKMWDWSLAQGNALGCASGIVGIWYGGVITVPFLTDCLDGPL